MDKTFISWNSENWITVLLMAAAGYLGFLGIARLLQQQSLFKKAA
jgi:hypothetical protein